MQRRLICVLGITILLCLVIGKSFAAGREMECREWVDKKYRGLYIFSFDSNSKALSATYKPEGENFLFGSGVRKWTVLWVKEHNAVFFGEQPEDWTGPLKLLSLNFSDVAMFAYSLGSTFEGSELVSKIERRCRRLD
jgi:hypothetical protein